MNSLLRHILNKVFKEQSGIPTFSDRFITHLIDGSEKKYANFIDYINFFEKKYLKQERFVNYKSNLAPSFIPYDFKFSQGITDCIKWKDKPIFKTAFDMVIIQMLLWELKPKTIIEIGSGNGSSAIYMRDLMSLYGNECSIFSFDINNSNDNLEQGIHFLYGDCNKIESLNKIDYQSLAHPWLVVEDAHENAYEVLNFLNSYAEPGDYFYIEDIDDDKKIALTKFLELSDFKLDLKYLDYFGKNVTCAKNGILKKVQ